jgi:hypothetical protein
VGGHSARRKPGPPAQGQLVTPRRKATLILQADRRARAAVAAIGDARLETGDLDTAGAAYEQLREQGDSRAVESRLIAILDVAAEAADAQNRAAEEQAFYGY